MMASATSLNDIDEQFLRCSICKEQLKEPKILPCLHRYCRECLEELVEKGAKKIECVTCREQHTLPKDGIGGLKTDFITTNIIEFIQLQDTVKVNPLRDCIHCNKKLKASAFCFRCNGFLCGTCHEFHASSSIVKDHHPHIFSLREAEAANLTIQKLSSLKEAPRCQVHPEKRSELCCTTCDNLPVCIACTYGEHKGHDLTEVTSLAKIQREMLSFKVVDLMQHKERAYQMPEEIRKTKEKLDHDVEEEKLKRQEHLDADEERFKKKIRNAEEELKRKQAELVGEVRAKTSMRKEDLEKKIKTLREEYELVCEEDRCKADASFKTLEEENKRETEQLQEGLRVVNNEFNELLTSLKTQKDEQAKKIRGLSDHFDKIVKRIETVITTVNCIRAAENDWADVQCIPDVCRAINRLSEYVKKGSTGLGNLSAVKVRANDDEVTFVGEKKATPEQIARAEKLLLPSNFFLYEGEPPSPGCVGCDGGEFEGPSLSGSPSGSTSSKLEAVSPSTSSALSVGSPGPGPVPVLLSLGDTPEQSEPAGSTPVSGFESPLSVGFTSGASEPGVSSLADMFRPSAGSWACDSCCLNNSEDQTACWACTTPKPEAQPLQQTASLISCGGPEEPEETGGGGMEHRSQTADPVIPHPEGGEGDEEDKNDDEDEDGEKGGGCDDGGYETKFNENVDQGPEETGGGGMEHCSQTADPVIPHPEGGEGDEEDEDDDEDEDGEEGGGYDDGGDENKFNENVDQGSSPCGSVSARPPSSKALPGLPSTTSAFTTGSPGMGSKPPGLFSVGDTFKQSDPAGPTPVGSFKSPLSVGFTFGASEPQMSSDPGALAVGAEPFGGSGFNFSVNTNANADSAPDSTVSDTSHDKPAAEPGEQKFPPSDGMAQFSFGGARESQEKMTSSYSFAFPGATPPSPPTAPPTDKSTAPRSTSTGYQGFSSVPKLTATDVRGAPRSLGTISPAPRSGKPTVRSSTSSGVQGFSFVPSPPTDKPTASKSSSTGFQGFSSVPKPTDTDAKGAPRPLVTIPPAPPSAPPSGEPTAQSSTFSGFQGFSLVPSSHTVHAPPTVKSTAPKSSSPGFQGFSSIPKPTAIDGTGATCSLGTIPTASPSGEPIAQSAIFPGFQGFSYIPSSHTAHAPPTDKSTAQKSTSTGFQGFSSIPKPTATDAKGASCSLGTIPPVPPSAPPSGEPTAQSSTFPGFQGFSFVPSSYTTHAPPTDKSTAPKSTSTGFQGFPSVPRPTPTDSTGATCSLGTIPTALPNAPPPGESPASSSTFSGFQGFSYIHSPQTAHAPPTVKSTAPKSSSTGFQGFSSVPKPTATDGMGAPCSLGTIPTASPSGEPITQSSIFSGFQGFSYIPSPHTAHAPPTDKSTASSSTTSGFQGFTFVTSPHTAHAPPTDESTAPRSTSTDVQGFPSVPKPTATNAKDAPCSLGIIPPAPPSAPPSGKPTAQSSTSSSFQGFSFIPPPQTAHAPPTDKSTAQRSTSTGFQGFSSVPKPRATDANGAPCALGTIPPALPTASPPGESPTSSSATSGFQGFSLAPRLTDTDTTSAAPFSFAGSGQFDLRPSVDNVAASSLKPMEKPTVESPALKSPGLSAEYYQSDGQDDLDLVVTLLEKMKLETSEEGEERGEVRFQHRAELYRWSSRGNQWKERGVGDITVLFNRETKKYKIFMRREQVHKVCADHFITEQVNLQPNTGSDRWWVWHAMDDLDGEGQFVHFAARFETEDAAKEFKDAVDAAKKDS